MHCIGLPDAPPSADAASSDVGVATMVDRGIKTSHCRGNVPSGEDGEGLPSCSFARVRLTDESVFSGGSKVRTRVELGFAPTEDMVDLHVDVHFTQDIALSGVTVRKEVIKKTLYVGTLCPLKKLNACYWLGML